MILGIVLIIVGAFGVFVVGFLALQAGSRRHSLYYALLGAQLGIGCVFIVEGLKLLWH